MFHYYANDTVLQLSLFKIVIFLLHNINQIQIQNQFTQNDFT